MQMQMQHMIMRRQALVICDRGDFLVAARLRATGSRARKGSEPAALLPQREDRAHGGAMLEAVTTSAAVGSGVIASSR